MPVSQNWVVKILKPFWLLYTTLPIYFELFYSSVAIAKNVDILKAKNLMKHLMISNTHAYQSPLI